MVQHVVRHFLRGLLVVVPVTLSLYLVWLGFATIERLVDPSPLIGRYLPGAGVLLAVVLVTIVGFLASNFATRWLFRSIDGVLSRLPLVKLIYGSLRDLTEAFVGDRKRFDTPVLVALQDAPGMSVIGFLTRDRLGAPGLDGCVSVYVPQSYNFAGQLLVVPRSRVTPLPLDGPSAMTFIVSGGVSGELSPGAQSPAKSGTNSP